MAPGIRRRLFLILAVLMSVPPAWIAAGERAFADTQEPPRLYLVGVGPGDPDLITLRAIKAIEQADVVFAFESFRDRFAPYLEGKQVHYGFWRLFPYYGQDPAELEGEERRACEQIARKRNQFIGIIRQAVDQQKTVAILDSGDPLIYGPYDWCLEEFEDLDPVVVPGVSCFNAANAALRRGITTGEQTKSVILTAADWPGKTDTIERLSAHQCTMVLFTMTAAFKEFIEKLSLEYPPETPVAVVERAGYREQERVIEATLGTIIDRIKEEELPFEYLIYVGDFLTHRYRKENAPAKD
jgi:precorrin-4/cobalt-precorrin-4 C11-methyltransferase